MRIMKWLGIATVLALFGTLFLPWVSIPSKNIVVTGFETAGTDFGKPGLLHAFLAGAYLLMLLIDKNWSRRGALLFTAFNTAWAVRNFFLISACHGGICPEKQAGLYLLLLISILMLVTSLLPDLELRRGKRGDKKD